MRVLKISRENLRNAEQITSEKTTEQFSIYRDKSSFARTETTAVNSAILQGNQGKSETDGRYASTAPNQQLKCRLAKFA
jgi:hypothetical protein